MPSWCVGAVPSSIFAVAACNGPPGLLKNPQPPNVPSRWVSDVISVGSSSGPSRDSPMNDTRPVGIPLMTGGVFRSTITKPGTFRISVSVGTVV